MVIYRKISGYWWCQLAGWGLVVLASMYYATTYMKQPVNGSLILQQGIFMGSGIATTHILRWFMNRKDWLLMPVEKLVWPLAAAILATTLVFSLLVMGLGRITGLETNKHNVDFFGRLLGNLLNFGMIYIIPWVLIYYFYHYLVKSRRQQLDTLRMEALVKELELKTIKSHINPHFIFNALNSIRALIDEDPARARNAVTNLSNILRSSMQADKLETVPFEKELNIVKDYLALEHIRFEDRLKVEYHIDEQTLTQPVPPMMLQTLVENAIKHGIAKSVSGGMVKVISAFRDDCHELTVQNSGILNGHVNSDGFGLTGTRNRLYLMFGNKAMFDIMQNGDLVEAKILIPKS